MKQLESVCQKFFQFKQWISASPIGAGNINDTYLVEVDLENGPFTFILQRINHHIFLQPAALMDNIYQVTNHLKRSQYPLITIAPYPTINGQLFHMDEVSNYWRCFPYLSDSYAPEGKTDAAMAYEAAKAYGAFSRALQDFPAQNLVETIPGFHDTDLRWDAFLNVLEADPVGRAKDAAKEIEALFQVIPVFETISRLKKGHDLPVRVTHNDTKAGNILFSNKTHKALSVIDLDTVMPGTILSDFGDMVRTFVPAQGEDAPVPVEIRSEILEALKNGFLSETGDFLSETEKEHLVLGGAWITGEQALRFLSDWLAGDKYYKVKSPEHNLERARNQLAVFEGLMGI